MKTFTNNGFAGSYDIVHMASSKDAYEVSSEGTTFTYENQDRKYIVNSVEELGFHGADSNGDSRFKWVNDANIFAPSSAISVPYNTNTQSNVVINSNITNLISTTDMDYVEVTITTDGTTYGGDGHRRILGYLSNVTLHTELVLLYGTTGTIAVYFSGINYNIVTGGHTNQSFKLKLQNENGVGCVYVDGDKMFTGTQAFDFNRQWNFGSTTAGRTLTNIQCTNISVGNAKIM